MSDEMKKRLETEIGNVPPGDALSGVSADDVEADAHEMLRFMEPHLKAKDVDGKRVPGLVDGGLSPDAEAALRYLADELTKTRFAGLERAPAAPFPVDEARRVAGELRAALECLAADDEALAEATETLRAEAPRTTSKDVSAWTLSLKHHLAVAALREDQLRALPGFDPEELDRARRLAAFQRGADDAAALAARRVKIALVAQGYLKRAQTAARFAFRNHPAIAALAVSSRVRRRAAQAVQTRRRNRKVAAAARADAARPAAAAGSAAAAQPAPAVQPAPAAQPAAAAQPAPAEPIRA